MTKYSDMSPYVAFNNNPTYYIDPNGLEGQKGSDPPRWRKRHGGIKKQRVDWSKLSIFRRGGPTWTGIANIGQKIKKGAPVGRMVNMGWYEGRPFSPDPFSQHSGSIQAKGNIGQRTYSQNLYTEMRDRAGTDNVKITGFDMRGTAPAGTFIRVTGGKSLAHLRPIFATNGIQNITTPSHLRMLMSDSEGNSTVPMSYFELRSGIIPGLNLLPSAILYNNMRGSSSPFAKFMSYMVLDMWMHNRFNYIMQSKQNPIWMINITAYNLNPLSDGGTVNFSYNYRYSAWQKWTTKSWYISIWHRLMWGT